MKLRLRCDVTLVFIITSSLNSLLPTRAHGALCGWMDNLCTCAEERSTGAGERSTGAEERSTDAGERSTGAEERSTGAEERSTCAEERSTGAEERSTGAGVAGIQQIFSNSSCKSANSFFYLDYLTRSQSSLSSSS